MVFGGFRDWGGGGVPHRGPCCKGILLFGGLFSGSPINSINPIINAIKP